MSQKLCVVYPTMNQLVYEIQVEERFGDLKTCEYGYPELCGKEAILRLQHGHNGFPGELFACREHYRAMSSINFGRALEVLFHNQKEEVRGGVVELAF